MSEVDFHGNHVSIVESYTVIDFGTTDHYFMTCELIEKKPCEKHSYTLVKVAQGYPVLHCNICSENKPLEVLNK